MGGAWTQHAAPQRTPVALATKVTNSHHYHRPLGVETSLPPPPGPVLPQVMTQHVPWIPAPQCSNCVHAADAILVAALQACTSQALEPPLLRGC